MAEQKIRKDSILIYYSWYEMMKTWSHKRFSIAIRALLDYGFYGVPLKEQELPQDIHLFLNTVTPQIDSNYKKYVNGSKGSKYGVKGGRPHKSAEEDPHASETPKGISVETPNPFLRETPNVNVNENVKENVYVYGNESGTGPGSEILHTDTEFFIPYFFFKKGIKTACYEAERFVNFYESKDWRVNGSILDTNKKRLNKAATWQPQDKVESRNAGFLVLWKKFYDAFPPELRLRMLEDKVEYRLPTGACEITAPKAVCAELERLMKEKEGLRKAYEVWSYGRTLRYKCY